MDSSIGQLLYSFDIPIITNNTNANTGVIINDIIDISGSDMLDISDNTPPPISLL